MAQTFGIPTPDKHKKAPHQAPARYLVVIGTADAMLARLFLATREQVAEFDASAEEVATMTRGLVPSELASQPEWDTALASHTAAERNSAKIYTLDV